jgi:acetyl esterase/lipase
MVSICLAISEPHFLIRAPFFVTGLASENANPYPRQLKQALSLIDYLVNAEKVSLSSITLIGDSAGAHLALSLLLHLSHPSPQIPPLKVEGKFAGDVLISPWVRMEMSTELMQANSEKDILSAASLAYWAKNYLGGATLEPWNAPFVTPDEWLSELPVDKILVTYGEDELFRDDIATFSERLKVSSGFRS